MSPIIRFISVFAAIIATATLTLASSTGPVLQAQVVSQPAASRLA